MLYSVEGIAVMTTPTGKKDFVAGDIVYIAADEELVVSNEGEEGVTLLAFLSPPFPPRE